MITDRANPVKKGTMIILIMPARIILIMPASNND